MNVDAYIESFEPEVGERLRALRHLILELAPDAEEGFAYQMPSYKLKGKPLVYFAGFRQHIGLYATPEAQDKFRDLLSPFKQGKGSVQFPLDKPLPLELIRQIVAYKQALILRR